MSLESQSAQAARSAVVRELAKTLRQAERSRQPGSASFADVDVFADRKRAASISTGIEPLDNLLPDGGFLQGTIVEWVCDEIGSGALTLALLSAAQILQQAVGQNLVVIDAAEDFYPVAASGLGLDLNRTVIVRPGSDGVSGGTGGSGDVRNSAVGKNRASRNNNVLWALEQALRSKAVGLTMCAIDHLNGHTFRRLQLAAEVGGGICFLRRPMAAIRQPTWADVRLLVKSRRHTPSAIRQKRASSSDRSDSLNVPAVRRLTVELLKCRSGLTGGSVELDYHDETNNVRLAAELARPAAAQRSARA